jgi:hypothetical protein
MTKNRAHFKLAKWLAFDWTGQYNIMKILICILFFYSLIEAYPSSESLYGRDKMTKYKVGLTPSIDDLSNYVSESKNFFLVVCWFITDFLFRLVKDIR